jgi:hypothetical protein
MHCHIPLVQSPSKDQGGRRPGDKGKAFADRDCDDNASHGRSLKTGNLSQAPSLNGYTYIPARGKKLGCFGFLIQRERHQYTSVTVTPGVQTDNSPFLLLHPCYSSAGHGKPPYYPARDTA